MDLKAVSVRRTNGESTDFSRLLISDRRDGPNGAEKCCAVCAIQRSLEKVIHHELVAVLQDNAVSYPTVTRFRKKIILGLDSEEVSSSPEDDRPRCERSNSAGFVR
jgi:hypothetical protein